MWGNPSPSVKKLDFKPSDSIRKTYLLFVGLYNATKCSPAWHLSMKKKFLVFKMRIVIVRNLTKQLFSETHEAQKIKVTEIQLSSNAEHNLIY